MAKRAPLTPVQREQIADLRGERGWGLERIAKHLGVSHGAVSYRCLIDGIERPGPFPKPQEWRGPLIAQRGSFQVRRFTPDEDEQLVRLDSEGHSLAEIGRRLGRRANSIKSRLATLARRDERALAIAENADG